MRKTSNKLAAADDKNIDAETHSLNCGTDGRGVNCVADDVATIHGFERRTVTYRAESQKGTGPQTNRHLPAENGGTQIAKCQPGLGKAEKDGGKNPQSNGKAGLHSYDNTENQRLKNGGLQNLGFRKGNSGSE